MGNPTNLRQPCLPSRTGGTTWSSSGRARPGLVAAAGAAGLGAKVALVERHLMGGDCLNYGCVPSKGIIRAGRAVAAVRDAGRFGVNVRGDWTVDFAAAMERMRKLRAGISDHDSAARFRDLGIDVFLGEGRFAGTDRLEVGGQTLRFSKAVIATGARAAGPADPRARRSRIPDQRDGLLPDGASPTDRDHWRRTDRLRTGADLLRASAPKSTSSKPPISILPREDPEAAEIVQKSLQRDGVRLLCCGKETQVRKDGQQVRLSVESEGTSYDEAVDKLLVAVGRAPNVESLNLEAAGVDYDRKQGVLVDDKLRTSNRRIFAAGDVCSRYKFTHAADFMARIVIRNALFMGRAKPGSLTIPWCTYTSPELAHVGLTPTGGGTATASRSTRTRSRWITSIGRFSTARRRALSASTCKKGTDRIVGASIATSTPGRIAAR